MDSLPPSRRRSLGEAALWQLEARLRARRLAGPSAGPSRLGRWLRIGLQALHVGNVVALLALVLLIPWVGERWWPVSLLVFLPPLAWLVPTFVLIPPTVRWVPRWLAATAIALVLGVWGLLRPVWSWPDAPAPGDLVVMTNNFGQHNRQSMRPFLEAENPDLVLLQEAVGRGPAFGQAYPEYVWRAHGEFVVLSRYPIVESGWVSGVNMQAARFVIERAGQKIVVYNIHLGSPRRALNAVASPRTLLQMALGRSGPETRLYEYEQRLQRRRDDALALLAAVQRETLPTIMGGDFNIPAGTWLYRQYARHWQDAHRHGGRGLGFTFPGETSQWVALRQPWLRIDYLFAGPGWQVADARTEPGRRSQHRAVAARFRLAERKQE